MSRGDFLRLFLNLLLCCTAGLSSIDGDGPRDGDQKQDGAILEMLRVDKISASVQGKPHPYMRRLYQRLGSPQGQGPDGPEGILVQSLRTSEGANGVPNGWIWFNITAVPPPVLAAELVLYRKTIHRHPLNVIVTLHSLSPARGAPHQGAALEERLLSLDQRPPSGYDVFDVWEAVGPAGAMVGFRLRYRDERGSLVLHDAITHSLYCMDKGALREPLLVLYHSYLALD